MVSGEGAKGGIIKASFCRMVEVIKEDRVDDLLYRDLLDLFGIVKGEGYRGDLCSVWSRDIHTLVLVCVTEGTFDEAGGKGGLARE